MAGSMASVHRFCDKWNAQGPKKLHALVNNAGANFMGIPPWWTEQGVAGLPQVNFLGPYTLTRCLAPSLTAAAAEDGDARIVNVASVMHRWSSLPHDPQKFLSDWSGNDSGGSYRNCKHAGVVFMLMLDQLIRQAQQDMQGTASSCAAGSNEVLRGPLLRCSRTRDNSSGSNNIHSNSMQHASKDPVSQAGRMAPRLRALSADPGFVHSGLWSTSKVLGNPPGSIVMQMLAAPTSDACATTVHAVTAADACSGSYWARGLFASKLITEAPLEILTAPFCLLDWPLRQATRGDQASHIAATQIGSEALAAARDGRGEALWNAAADLAGLPSWTRSIEDFHVPSKEARVHK
uniref:Uncharacterized protein n=1 Tax=Dunaliella tertiolecta TaxID=3047 RepID=A0A7S3VHE6_DUNTE